MSTIKVQTGQLDSYELPISGAQLCGASPQSCFSMPSSSPPGEKPGFYQFGLDPQWKQLTLVNDHAWLLFSATFSGGGSGELTRFAILRVACAPSSVQPDNLLPDVSLTNQSQHAVWDDARLSHYPLFVTADFLWNFETGETHFGRHRYEIHVWRFEPAKKKYVRILEYKTAHRFKGLDEAGNLNVLAPERPEIRRRLLALKLQPEP